jgi:3-oxoacyl-[acyl-carrier protein] reductase
MTADTFGAAPAEGADPLSTEHVAPLVAYLAGPAAQAISGQVFVVHGGMVALLAPPTVEQRFDAEGGGWTLADLHDTVGAHFADADPTRMFVGADVLRLVPGPTREDRG